MAIHDIPELRLELVPHHLSHSLAHKIFFIGESIQLFESDRRVEVQGAVLKAGMGQICGVFFKFRIRSDIKFSAGYSAFLDIFVLIIVSSMLDRYPVSSLDIGPNPDCRTGRQSSATSCRACETRRCLRSGSSPHLWTTSGKPCLATCTIS